MSSSQLCYGFKSLLIGASMLALASSTALAADPVSDDTVWVAPEAAEIAARWNAWGGIGGYYGTDNRSYGELLLFAPVWQNGNSLVFTDVRGKLFEDEILEGNAAIGYRQMMANGFNFGVWGGLDVRRTQADNTFGQVSGGVELLGEYLDFRVNGYLPFTDKQLAPGNAEVELTSSNIFMTGAWEVPLHGVDGEAGFRLSLGEAENSGHIGFYGGAYHFDSDDIDKAISGGKARAELGFNDIGGTSTSVTARYEYTNDDVRGERHTVGLRLSMPLGEVGTAPSRMTTQQWRMMEDLERDTDIVIADSGREQVADGYTDVRFDRVAWADDGTSLQDGIDKGANTLIILDGANGDVEGGKTLAAEQTLLGRGGKLKVIGEKSGAVAYLTPGGTQPIIAGDGNLLTMANSTHASGLHFKKENDTTTANAVFGSGASNVALTYNTIETQGTDSHAIWLDGGSRFIVHGNEIATAGTNALGVFVNTSDDIHIKKNIITTSGAEAEAVAIWQSNENVHVTGNTLKTTSTGDKAHGIIVGKYNMDLHINDNTVETAGKNAGGIVFLSESHDIWANNNNITTTGEGAQGFFFENKIYNVHLDGNIVETNGYNSEALLALNNNYNFWITNNRFTTTSVVNTPDETEAHGIKFGNNNADIWITGNAINTAGEQSQGTYFLNNNTRVTFSDNNVTTTGLNAGGFVLFNSNSNVLVSGNTFDTMGEGIWTNRWNTNLTVRDNIFTSGKTVLSFGRGNTMLISGNQFVTNVTDDAIFFRSGAASTVLAGSTGNTIAPGTTIGGQIVCGSPFNGFIEIDGINYGSPPPAC